MRQLSGLFKARYDIRPYSVIAQELRTLLMGRVCLLATACLIFFISLLTPGQYLFYLDFGERLLTNLIFTFFFYGTTFFLLPLALHAGLVRNIPWLWIELIFYIPVAFIVAVGLVLFFYDRPAVGTVLFYFGLIMINVVLAVTLTILIFKDAILVRFSDNPDYFPLWMPGPDYQCHLNGLLPPEKRGTVLRLEADNQYIQVYTEKGNALLRLSLTEAEKMVPEKAGVRIHRSHWIQKERIDELFFENGNPRIRDKGGLLLPVSRNAVPAVREVLQD